MENSRDIYPFCQHPHRSHIFKFRLLSTIYAADTGLLATVPGKQLHYVSVNDGQVYLASESQLMVFISSLIKLTKVRESTESLGFSTAKKKINFSQ